MKLLQWNIRYSDSLENVARVVAEIKRFGADVVCLQEVCYKDNIDNLNPLFELYPHSYFCRADSFPNKYTQGNAILSRYPIISKRDIFIQKSGDNTKFDDEGRVYIEADLDIDGRVLTVGTTHGSYTDRFAETPAKDREVANLLDIIKTKKSNYIFAGDLNTVPTSKYIRDIGARLKNLDPKYGRNTWTTKPFSYNGFDADELKYRLDYVFGTDDINLVRAEILRTDISDHLPILTKV